MKTEVLAVVGSFATAIVSLLIQYLIHRSTVKNDRAKLFYSDRLSAFKNLSLQFSNILRNAENVTHFKSVMSGKIMFKDLFDNVGSRMPKNLHDGFVSSVMNATVQGRKMIREEVDRNQIFYTDSIRHILDEFDRKYLDQIPDPLEPSTIDTFLEQKMDFLKLSRDRINEEFQRTLRLK